MWKSSDLLREAILFDQKIEKTPYFSLLLGPHPRKVAPLINSSGSTDRESRLWPDEFVFSKLGIRHLPIGSGKVQNPNSTPQRTGWTRHPKRQRELNASCHMHIFWRQSQDSFDFETLGQEIVTKEYAGNSPPLIQIVLQIAHGDLSNPWHLQS